jgi:hypothetical protein
VQLLALEMAKASELTRALVLTKALVLVLAKAEAPVKRS